jgi:hypothetical protein
MYPPFFSPHQLNIIVVNEYENKQYYHVDTEAAKNKEADTDQNIMTTFFVLFLFPSPVHLYIRSFVKSKGAVFPYLYYHRHVCIVFTKKRAMIIQIYNRNDIVVT